MDINGQLTSACCAPGCFNSQFSYAASSTCSTTGCDKPGSRIRLLATAPPQSPRPSDLGFFLFFLAQVQPLSQRMSLGNTIASFPRPYLSFQGHPHEYELLGHPYRCYPKIEGKLTIPLVTMSATKYRGGHSPARLFLA